MAFHAHLALISLIIAHPAKVSNIPRMFTALTPQCVANYHVLEKAALTSPYHFDISIIR